MKNYNLYSLAFKISWMLLMVTFLFTCELDKKNKDSTTTTSNSEETTSNAEVETAAMTEEETMNDKLGYYLQLVENQDGSKSGMSIILELLAGNKLNIKIGDDINSGTYEFLDNDTKLKITTDGESETLDFTNGQIEQMVNDYKMVYKKVSESEALQSIAATKAYMKKQKEEAFTFEEWVDYTPEGKYTLTQVTGTGATEADITTYKNILMNGSPATLDLTKDGQVSWKIPGEDIISGTYIFNKDDETITLSINGKEHVYKVFKNKITLDEDGIFFELKKE